MEKDVRFAYDHFDLVEVLSTVPDFQVSVAKPLNLQHSWPAFATMQGCCKWFYKYEFLSDGKIKAYECSGDATAKKEFTRNTERFKFIWQQGNNTDE
jgi:hypothetical protein